MCELWMTRAPRQEETLYAKVQRAEELACAPWVSGQGQRNKIT